MPVRKVPGGYQWGNHGKVYASKEKAEAQGRAAYANGYKGDAKTIVDAVLSADPNKARAQGRGKDDDGDGDNDDD